MKWLGVGLLLGTSILTGFWLSGKLREREKALRLFRKLLTRFMGELRYKRPSTRQLLQEAAASAEFRDLSYLSKAASRFDGTAPLESVWSKAVLESRLPLQKEDQAVLLEIGGVLGSTDGESQQEAFSLIIERVDALIQEAGNKAFTEGKLCRSLGVLAGLAIAVLAL